MFHGRAHGAHRVFLGGTQYPSRGSPDQCVRRSVWWGGGCRARAPGRPLRPCGSHPTRTGHRRTGRAEHRLCGCYRSTASTPSPCSQPKTPGSPNNLTSYESRLSCTSTRGRRIAGCRMVAPREDYTMLAQGPHGCEPEQTRDGLAAELHDWRAQKNGFHPADRGDRTYCCDDHQNPPTPTC